VARPTIGAAEPGSPLADQATYAAVTATVTEFVACLNAGDRRRADALLTDRYVTELLGRHGIDTPFWNELTDRPKVRSAEDRQMVVAVDWPVRQASGGVWAFVILADAAEPSSFVRFLLDFDFERGRYRIDAIAPAG
jgi:hypothetical protein